MVWRPCSVLAITLVIIPYHRRTNLLVHLLIHVYLIHEMLHFWMFKILFYINLFSSMCTTNLFFSFFTVLRDVWNWVVNRPLPARGLTQPTTCSFTTLTSWLKSATTFQLLESASSVLPAAWLIQVRVFFRFDVAIIKKLQWCTLWSTYISTPWGLLIVWHIPWFWWKAGWMFQLRQEICNLMKGNSHNDNVGLQEVQLNLFVFGTLF